MPAAAVATTVGWALPRQYASTATTDSGYTPPKEEQARDQSAFEHVSASFAAFHAEVAALFGRKEVQRRSEQYLRGLWVQQTDRRNAETIAGATPRALQRLLSEAPWQTGPVIDRLQAAIGARLNEAVGVFVVDESGFPKQGRHSVGVARQYCGSLSKVANCRMGIFLAYASSRGQALVDMRLFLPKSWTEDQTRMVEALAAGLPAAAWQAPTVAEGSRGLRTSRFVARRVWAGRAGLPGRACWVPLRRNLDGGKPRFYRSNAPADTAALTLAQVGATRWIIEAEFQTAKGENRTHD